ncbi:NAD(P)/FAD-dependent oxidoreductase [Agromyces sp. NPDC049794]|uniref:flavin-containing monooxygenase n=1 Tax=unclassified Agromyces TaxID=2639701 RepID=UPI00340507F5
MLTEREIREAVKVATVPVLLMVVYQVTGDEKWLSDRYRPSKFRGVAPRVTGDLADDVQDEIRAAAIEAIRTLLDGREPAVAMDDDERVKRIAGFFVGEPISDRHAAILREELKRRASSTGEVAEEDDEVQITAPEGFKAIIIGAGVSGLAAIHNLGQLGIEFEIFERGSEAGGVWFQNTYPGAGVDTPSHLYSLSFSYKDWIHHYELRDELYGYFNHVLDELGARDKVRFNTEVLSAHYDEEKVQWTVTTRDPDGALTEHTADMVVSAVGSLNQPVLPDVPGREAFAGVQFHSNEWDHDIDLTGKRVAIVGVGASCQQIAPRIAQTAAHLTIVQRSPQWIAPFDQFCEPIEDGQRRLLAEVPLYRAWYWLGLFWQQGDKIIDALRIDPEWPHPDRSINRRNDRQREFLTGYIKEQLAGRPDLIEASVPDYPPFGKRMLMDNGWYRTLLRDNVSLVTGAVSSVDETGLQIKDAVHLDVDVIIWATGFAASRFLSSYEVKGENDLLLSEYWEEDDPRAYLGVGIPHFPNLFMVGGPHSLPPSGSFMYFTELQARYLRDLLKEMFTAGVQAIAPTEEATKRYNDLVDEYHSRTVWTHPGFSTYYRNRKGRVIFVMPFLNVEYWDLVKTPTLDDYVAHERIAAISSSLTA